VLLSFAFAALPRQPYKFDPRVIDALHKKFENDPTLSTVKFQDQTELRAIRDMSTGQIYAMTSKRHPEFNNILGKGAYGVVKVGQNIDSGEMIAIKKPGPEAMHAHTVFDFIKENRFLPRDLKVSSYVSAKRTKKGMQKPYLMMKPVDGYIAFDFLFSPNLNDQGIAVVLQSMLEALNSLHKEGIVHRDAHTGNFIIKQIGKAQIIDMGMAAEATPMRISLDYANSFVAWAKALRDRMQISPYVQSLIDGLNAKAMMILDSFKLDENFYIEELVNLEDPYFHLNTFIEENMTLSEKFLSDRPLSDYLNTDVLTADYVSNIVRLKIMLIDNLYAYGFKNVDPSIDRTRRNHLSGKFEIVKRPNSPIFQGPGNLDIDKLESVLAIYQGLNRNMSPDIENVRKNVSSYANRLFTEIITDRKNVEYLQKYTSDFPLVSANYSKFFMNK
jgi:serine/threonine protein kinase